MKESRARARARARLQSFGKQTPSSSRPTSWKPSAANRRLAQGARAEGESGAGVLQHARPTLEVETLEQVVRALSRIDAGTYGEVSGKPIPIERLEAVPYAATLVDEQPLEPE